MPQTVCSPGGLRLRDVFPRGRAYGADDIAVRSCCSDWQRCRDGDLFVALNEADADGHEDAHQAIARGASAVLAERPLALAAPVYVVDDTRAAYGTVCQALAGWPSRQMRTIGVTGTAGKTITAMLLAGVFKAAGARVGMTGSLGYCDSVDAEAAGPTTPRPPQLARWMARMTANGCSHAIVEASSESLVRRELTGVQFDAAVLTNVRRDHLDLHGSLLNYRKAKARLFEHLKPGGFAVVNADDPASKLLLGKLTCPLMTVALDGPAEVSATLIERHRSEQTFLLNAGSESVPVRTTLIGNQHIYNCLIAAAVGLVEGIDLPTIARGLETVDYVPGRLERLECGQSFGVFVDQARTPDTLAGLLRTLRQVTTGQLYCVFGAEGECRQEVRPLLGRTVERLADLGVITSDNPRSERPLHVIHDILDGYDDPAAAHVMPNRTAAIGWVLSRARPGDCVLIAGRGCNDQQQIGSQVHRLDDREVATAWLRDNVRPTAAWPVHN